MFNLVDMRMIMLEKPNIKQHCNLNTLKEIDDYLIMYSVYNNLLIQYLCEFYRLKVIDDELYSHSHLFSPVNLSDFDLSQYCVKGTLRYLFLKNFIHVEKLNEDDKNTLIGIYDSKNFQLNNKSRSFVERTLENVVLSEYDGILNIGCYYEINDITNIKARKYIKELLNLLQKNINNNNTLCPVNIFERAVTKKDIKLLKEMVEDKISIMNIKEEYSSEYKKI